MWVARCAQRTLLVDHRPYAVVEEVDQTLDGGYLYARVAVGEGLDLEQQDQANHLLRNALARTAGVRHDEVFLQVAQPFLVHRDVAQRAEAGRHTVDGGGVLFGFAVQIVAAALDACAGIVGEFEFVTAHGDLIGLARRDVLGRYFVDFHLDYNYMVYS